MTHCCVCDERRCAKAHGIGALSWCQKHNLGRKAILQTPGFKPAVFNAPKGPTSVADAMKAAGIAGPIATDPLAYAPRAGGPKSVAEALGRAYQPSNYAVTNAIGPAYLTVTAHDGTVTAYLDPYQYASHNLDLSRGQIQRQQQEYMAALERQRQAYDPQVGYVHPDAPSGGFDGGGGDFGGGGASGDY